MMTSAVNIRVNQFCFGKPEDALSLERFPLPLLEPGKVRVQIEATNINPSDMLSIHGVGQYRHSHRPPRVPGFEAVGQVIESHQDNFAIGQKVVVATSGTWQKYIDVSPDNLFPIPQDLENGYACQLYINALTAWVLITEMAHLTSNDVLIINAGSSAIGKIFAQLSLSVGFTLIVVTSRPQHYPYPSVHVLDASDDLVAQIQKHNLPAPNIAFDAIGGNAGEALIRTVASDGRYINYGTLSLEFYGSVFYELIKQRKINFSTFFLRNWENKAGKAVRRETFQQMLEHFLAHKIQLDVEYDFPLEEFQTAIHLIENPSVTLHGKIILTLA